MFILALIACTNVENYDEQTIAASCQRWDECEKASFEDNYDDLGECQDDQADYFEDLYDCYVENCEFDAQQASACLASQRSVSCEDWGAGDFGSDCDDVFTDCDDVDLALCLVGA